MTGQVDLSISREFDLESNIIWKPFNLCALLKRLCATFGVACLLAIHDCRQIA